MFQFPFLLATTTWRDRDFYNYSNLLWWVLGGLGTHGDLVKEVSLLDTSGKVSRRCDISSRIMLRNRRLSRPKRWCQGVTRTRTRNEAWTDSAALSLWRLSCYMTFPDLADYVQCRYFKSCVTHIMTVMDGFETTRYPIATPTIITVAVSIISRSIARGMRRFPMFEFVVQHA